MARMMDIGRPTTPPKKEEPKNPTPEPKQELETGFLDEKETITNNPVAETAEPAETDKQPSFETPEPKLTEAKKLEPNTDTPRKISSYAIAEDNEAKTFPLAPVLAVIGIVIVLGVVYLLVFV